MHPVVSSLFLLVFLFFLDVIILLRVGQAAGWAVTLFWVGATLAGGWALLVRPVRSSRPLSPGALLSRPAAAVLLMLPGLLSDLLGICLLVPRLRGALARWLLPQVPGGVPGPGWAAWFSRDASRPAHDPPRASPEPPPGAHPPAGPVRDAEFEMLQEDTDGDEDS